MDEGLKLSKNGRYLEKINDGRILPWTKRLADRKDMREFIPQFDKEGELIQIKETSERMAELEAENTRLSKLLADKGDTTVDPEKEEEIILGDLEEELDPNEGKPVTREFLLTRGPDELRDYALKVFGEKLNSLKKQETLVNDILDLQKKMAL